MYRLNTLYDETEVCIKCSITPKCLSCPKKKHLGTVWDASWTSCSFFFLWNLTFILKTMFIQVWIFGKYFVKNKWSELVTSRKTLTALVTMIQFEHFGKPVSTTMSLTASQMFKDFADEICADTNKCSFLIMYTVKYVNIWKVCLSQWKNIFQTTNRECYRIKHWFKVKID